MSDMLMSIAILEHRDINEVLNLGGTPSFQHHEKLVSEYMMEIEQSELLSSLIGKISEDEREAIPLIKNIKEFKYWTYGEEVRKELLSTIAVDYIEMIVNRTLWQNILEDIKVSDMPNNYKILFEEVFSKLSFSRRREKSKLKNSDYQLWIPPSNDCMREVEHQWWQRMSDSMKEMISATHFPYRSKWLLSKELLQNITARSLWFRQCKLCFDWSEIKEAYPIYVPKKEIEQLMADLIEERKKISEWRKNNKIAPSVTFN